MWGAAWRKSTSFLHWGLSLEPLERRRCQGAKRGLCARTGLPHVALRGRAAGGAAYLTKQAEPYPHQLCLTLASCFRESRCALTAAQLDHYLQPPGALVASRSPGTAQLTLPHTGAQTAEL